MTPLSKPNTAPAGKRGRPRRYAPPLSLRIIVVAILALMLWIRVADSSGDQGITNVNTVMLAILGLLILTPWFVFFSAYRWQLRFGLPLLVVAGGASFVLLLRLQVIRYEGVSGNMIPRLRMAEDVERPEAIVREGGGAVDLVTRTPWDFPAFLGADRSATVAGVRLDTDWESNPPQEVWRQPIGQGWSAFAVVNGVAITMEQRGDMEEVTAYDAETGELLWARGFPGRYSHPLGGIGPRSTPSIAQGRVYALGAGGRLVCLDGSSGKVLWEKDLLAEYEVSPQQEFANIQFGRSNSPLVLDGMLVIPAGGNKGGRIASLAAFSSEDGSRIWEAGERQISFASPAWARLAGRDQILIVNEDTLSGHDPQQGTLLWEHPWPGNTASNASSSQAVPVPPDQVFVSKGYGGGAALLRLVADGNEGLQVEEVWADNRVMRTKFTQVVLRDGYVYGLSDGILECIRLATGERMWKGGRYQHGQILGVGDHLLVLSEDGELVLVAADPAQANHVLGRFQALVGPTWNNLALYGDLLLVRNSREAAAWRLPLQGEDLNPLRQGGQE